MKLAITPFVRLFLVLGSLVCSLPAQAAYRFTIIDYPGAAFTQVFGINNSGSAVGIASDSLGVTLAAFSYDLKKGTFTTITPDGGSDATSVLGINEPGVMVGALVSVDTERGFVRAKNGAYTAFSHPGWDNTEARAINNTGLVTGLSNDSTFTHSVGFIYDPARDTFIDILPSPSTIAQGINNQGQVVGSVTLKADDACQGCGAGRYGWLRSPSGDITLFRVNGHSTAARGVSDSGVVTGFVVDPGSGKTRGFVTTVGGVPGYQLLTISPDDLLDVPGADATFPEGISNAGAIAGYWMDSSGAGHGFVATPVPPNGK